MDIDKSKSDFFIITRFNLRLWSKDKHNISTQTEKWLEERFDLFQKICYPSILGQIDQNFCWIVLFDKNTPDKFKELIEQMHHEYSNFQPYFLDQKDTKEFIAFSRKIILGKAYGNSIITLRLDNDDALNHKYIHEVKYRMSKLEGIRLLSFRYGIQYLCQYNLAVRIPYSNNHFLAMKEPLCDDIKTVYSCNHFFVKESGLPFTCIDNKKFPFWIETIHSSNIDNDLKMTLNLQPIIDKTILLQFGIDKTITPFYSIIGYVTYILPRFLYQVYRRFRQKIK